ncbi:MAG: hypothetical protein HY785_28430 [Oscillatoriophycideae cyanobacterium NC_groundwater_1537_Pr4_S-0.65um_50_18]|nr:hypothetical protein [Oscillatoriophycideae cyanobacterium NC_groundwater_1537_Pr4_S-0.65um_50_18]
MTQVINDNLQINGDTYLKADNHVSLHYGNRGRLGQTPNFNPDNNSNGLWLEASADGLESGGIFCNGNTIVLWSPGDNDTLRIYDEDELGSANLVPKFVINNIGNVGLPGSIGIGTLNPQAGKVEIKSPWGDWMFLRQERNVEGEGGFHIHNPWGNSDQSQGDPSRNRLEIAYRTSTGQDLWGQFVIHGPTGNVGIGTANPQAKLDVNGDIKVKDWTLSVPDYVFAQNYELRNLDDLRTYIDRHKHLPEVPSAQQVSEEGVNLGEFCMSLLKKIEELSLYMLQQHEIIQAHNERLAQLEQPASL